MADSTYKIMEISFEDASGTPSWKSPAYRTPGTPRLRAEVRRLAAMKSSLGMLKLRLGSLSYVSSWAGPLVELMLS
jgi:hypothetical protein